MRNLIIVESPSKARNIQRFLGKKDGKDTPPSGNVNAEADARSAAAGEAEAPESQVYTVKSSEGHICDLKENALSIDIANGFKPEYVVPDKKKKIVSELKKEAAKADVVWLASDEDREGEAISWHLCETLGLDKSKTHRIAFHEITEPAVRHALANPRDIDMNLVNAQQARRVLDRLVGFELSPVLWRKIQPKLSAGRVQSVALRLIVDREREIIAFNKEKYYKVEAHFHPEGVHGNVDLKASLEKRLPDLAAAEDLLTRCNGARFAITDIAQKEASRCPASPFTTSLLQQEAARRLHLSVNQTMSIAQKLYEEGYITYMRTDSTNLSGLAIGAAKEFILENFGPEYHKARQYKTKSKGAQEAHEAIRPTFIKNVTIPGTAQEQKLYELIWKRTVASQMADARVSRTDLKIGFDKGEEKFAVKATKILFDGFMKLYIDSDPDGASDEGEDVILPDVKVGMVMEERGISALGKFTTPPARYTDGTLVKKLEELGIGRPSTYGPTIATLTSRRGYVVWGDKTGETVSVTDLKLKDGKISQVARTETVGAEKHKLLPQDIGMIVTDFLVENFGPIMDYGFTADVEQDFDQVAEGKKVWNSVISEFYDSFHGKVESTLNNGTYSHVSRELGVDPSDGQMLVARYGQYGPYVQKGEGDNKVYASLAPGQLIESLTLEEACKLFALPRTVGQHNGIDVICTKGRFGPYIKYGEKNVSLPRGKDPLKVGLDECVALIEAALNKPAADIIAEFADGIQVIKGNYGPYIKQNGGNYRIPKGTDAYKLTEDECRNIIANTKPTGRKFKKR